MGSSEDNNKEDLFIPGIDNYLESIDDNISVTTKDLDELILKIRSTTDVTNETAKIIVKLFFQEIRNLVLRKNIVVIRNFGKFLISSPLLTNNKRKIFPIFKPSKKLIKLLNE